MALFKRGGSENENMGLVNAGQVLVLVQKSHSQWVMCPPGTATVTSGNTYIDTEKFFTVAGFSYARSGKSFTLTNGEKSITLTQGSTDIDASGVSSTELANTLPYAPKLTKSGMGALVPPEAIAVLCDYTRFSFDVVK